MNNLDGRMPPEWPMVMALFNGAVDSIARKRPAGKDSKKDIKNEFTKVTQGSPMAHEFVDRRIIRITGPIDDVMATHVISQMHMLEAMGQGKDIELRINSPGGSVTAGLAIFDAMKMLNCDVKTVCEGECASMAAVLLAAGTPGKRFAMPNSTIMIHGPSGGMQGTDVDMHIYMKEILRLKNIMIDILSDYMGQSRTKVESMMERDHFMGPQEAKSLGVVDDVVELRHKPPAPRQKTGGNNFVMPPLMPVDPNPQQPTLH